MRTSLICLMWLGIKIIIYQPYSSTFVSQSLTSDTIHLSSFKARFLKNKVVIFHFEVMITNIVYILKTLFHTFFPDLLCPLFMHTFWHLVIYHNNGNLQSTYHSAQSTEQTYYTHRGRTAFQRFVSTDAKHYTFCIRGTKNAYSIP